MGASGSAWIKPRKRTGLRPAAFRDLPHPHHLRPGQRFFALQKRNGSSATVQLTRVPAAEDWCEARREDASGATTRLKKQRLLAVTEAGAGRHYRFIGYADRTYRTHAYVAAVEGAWVHVICPEWHPRHAIAVALRGVPEPLRRQGIWLACRARLAADKPGLVQPVDLAPPKRGFSPERYHAPAPMRAQPVGRDDDEPPAAGPGCGDVLIYARRARSLQLTGHPPPVRPGGRVYLHHDGRVQGWSPVERVTRSPGGTTIYLAPEWQEVSGIDAPPRPPAAGVAGGAHGHQLWRWRTWDREQRVSRSSSAAS